jgi:hypothetical protein
VEPGGEGPQVLLRESRASRAWVFGVSLVWCGLLIAFTASRWPIPVSLLILRAVGVAFAVCVAFRVLSMRLETRGGDLLVRNLWRTHRLRRRDVRRVWIGEPLSAPLPGGWLPGPRGEALNVEARGKLFTVDVSREWLGRRKARQRLASAVKELEAWRSAAGGHG